MPLAALPYAVMQLDRGLRRLLRGFGSVPVLIFLLLVAATIPPIIEGSEQQPLMQSVDDLRDGVSSLASWVRMRGEITTLSPPRDVENNFEIRSLLVEPSGDAVLLISNDPIDHLSEITGRAAQSGNAGDTARGIGGERFPAGDIDVIDRYVVRVDDPVVPPENRSWWLVWSLLGAAAVLFIGYRMGYPIVRVHREEAAAGGGGRPLEIGEELRVRLIEPQEEAGTRLEAPWAVLRRLSRNDPADPYFEMRVEGQPRPILFRRHRWSRALPGTITLVRERMPVVRLHDWGIEVLLGLRTDADRDRLLASFAIDDEEEALPAAEPARA
jgi:hypothetical protein